MATEKHEPKHKVEHKTKDAPESHAPPEGGPPGQIGRDEPLVENQAVAGLPGGGQANAPGHSHV